MPLIDDGQKLTLKDDADVVASNTLTMPVSTSQPLGLSRNVVSGVVHSFKIVLWVAATADEGLQFDLNGGSITVTWLKAMFKGYDGFSLAFIAQSLALATAVGPQDAFSGAIEIEGSFEPSSSGTFAPRIAQTTHGAGSVQALKGSSHVLMEAI